jgi:hypothetical protein
MGHFTPEFVSATAFSDFQGWKRDGSKKTVSDACCCHGTDVQQAQKKTQRESNRLIL